MNTREKLLDSARYLIQTRGYNGFSYADVAEQVEVRKASIHHHFPTKADLARAVVEQSRAAITEQTRLIEGSEFDPLRQLLFYTGYWERCIADASAPFCVAGMLASELPSLPEDLAEGVRAHFRDLSRWLETVLTRGAQLGVFRLKGAASAEAESFMSTVYGAMLTARAYGEPAKFSQIVQGALRRLLAPEQPSPPPQA
ncbi:TetR/AcrR family transcriptional regulator [Fulvimonas soli]|jgi:TetR/AcrR family transcriptional repressor of nem operon|uniref:TetR family transcriptional regulator n=1 Tax=Fulvimonas soli TaxID=155197 RepID=A0A316III8_9GAMM|nr:TetR/AcrR family transcriptional regulator [Fulvimonas soli]PWK92720.1 TetR family transcriptional regulator [Fulvimonas soli]TNY25899.1 TetR family transcriptional regulator [Fulvimonas soli]